MQELWPPPTSSFHSSSTQSVSLTIFLSATTSHARLGNLSCLFLKKVFLLLKNLMKFLFLGQHFCFLVNNQNNHICLHTQHIYHSMCIDNCPNLRISTMKIPQFVNNHTGGLDHSTIFFAAAWFHGTRSISIAVYIIRHDLLF